MKAAKFIITILIVLGLFVVYQKYRDPITLLDQNIGQVLLHKEDPISAENLPKNRVYRHIYLETENLGIIEADISQPKQITEKLPVLLVMSGWEADANSFRLIPNPGDYLLVIYRYPYIRQRWKEGYVLPEAWRMRKAIYTVPSQILTLSEWLSHQTYVDKDRISLLGFSLGALFLPAIFHLDTLQNRQLNTGVIAFGGADIGDMLQTYLRNVSKYYRPLVAHTAAFMVDAVEPSHHLPHIDNRFLLINAKNDETISPYSRDLLLRLTPDPKTVVTLDSGHIGINKVKLVHQVVDISTTWLTEQGILRPP